MMEKNQFLDGSLHIVAAKQMLILEMEPKL